MNIFVASRNPISGHIEISMIPGTHAAPHEIHNCPAPDSPESGPWIDAYINMWNGEEQIMISSSYSALDHMAISATHGRPGDFRVFRAAGGPAEVISQLNEWLGADF